MSIYEKSVWWSKPGPELCKRGKEGGLRRTPALDQVREAGWEGTETRPTHTLTLPSSPRPGTVTHRPQTSRHGTILCQAQGTPPVCGVRTVWRGCVSPLTVSLNCSRDNLGSGASPVAVGVRVPEAKAVAPGPCPSLPGRGRGLGVKEWGLGEGEDTLSPTWRPQTRPRGRGALGVQKPAWPESALP